MRLLERHGLGQEDQRQIAKAGHARPGEHLPTIPVLVALVRAVYSIHAVLEELMAQVDELETQLSNLQTAVQDATTRVANDLGSLHSEVQALQEQIAQGGSPDLSGLLTHVAAIKQTVDAIDPLNIPAPVVEPTQPSAPADPSASPDSPPAPASDPSQPAGSPPADTPPGDAGQPA